MALFTLTPRDTADGGDRHARDGNRRVVRFEREAVEDEILPRIGAGSPTGIANLALSYIGAGTILNIDDNNHESRVMRLFYNQERDSLLRSHRWNFALARVTLGKLTSAPDSQWAFQFTLPDDCLRVLQVNGRDQFDQPSNWQVEGKRLVSNAETAQVLYVRRAENVKEFDPLFVEALYLGMAAKAADILVGDRELAKQIRTQFAVKVASMARLADEWESKPRLRAAWEVSGMVQRRVPMARGGLGTARGEVIIPLSKRRARVREDLFGQVVSIVLESQGQQDDDLRVVIDGVTVSDTRWNIGWYKNENFVTSAVPPFTHEDNSGWWRKIVLDQTALQIAMGRLPRRGDVVAVDVFDGWGNIFVTNPWTLTATWSGGAVTTYSGGKYSTGQSAGIAMGTVIVDLAALFPPKVGGPGELYGVVTLGPYSSNAEVWSRATDPAGANDDLVINGSVVYQNNESDYVNGGVDTQLATVTAGNTWSVNVRNRTGYTDDMGGFGKLMVEGVPVTPPAGYYSSGPHLENYIENGKVTL